MNNEYKENDQYAQIGRDLIENEEAFELIKKHRTRIAYLESNKPAPKSGKTILGECRTLTAKTRELLAAGIEESFLPDFFIIIYAERIKHFTPEQTRILIMHELMHISVKEDDDGNAVFRLKKHDMEDFRAIVERFGVDWAGDGQITWQQLMDDKPEPKEKSEMEEILNDAKEKV